MEFWRFTLAEVIWDTRNVSIPWISLEETPEHPWLGSICIVVWELEQKRDPGWLKDPFLQGSPGRKEEKGFSTASLGVELQYPTPGSLCLLENSQNGF